jgi:predicted MFS family arabinose efflux permease
MCAAEVATLIGVFAFPALLPNFQIEWSLSNTDAGWINGVYFAGYTMSVAVLTSLTDRMDARRIYLGGALVTLAASLAFAAFAQGFWSALCFQCLAGVGLAATYMPGLKALLDRYQGAKPPRASAYYTASFSLGSATSYSVVGAMAAWAGWRGAFLAAALGGVLAFLLAFFLLKPMTVTARPHEKLLDFRPVLRNRAAMGYILAYGAHCWELFGQRGWLVTFLAFVLASNGLESGGALAPTTVASLCALIAMASSILGGEAAMKFSRPKTISAFMLTSAIFAGCLGFMASLPYGVVAALCMVYSIFVQGDSAALTAGAIEASEPGRRGATMAVHSVVGFGCAFFGPVGMGIALDLAGGKSVFGWGMAFASLGAVVALGPLALFLLTSRAGGIGGRRA